MVTKNLWMLKTRKIIQCWQNWNSSFWKNFVTRLLMSSSNLNIIRNVFRAYADMNDIKFINNSTNYNSTYKILFIFSKEVDKEVWNAFIEQLDENNTYFSIKWLYAECYLYRRLKSIFEKTWDSQIYSEKNNFRLDVLVNNLNENLF